MALNKKTLTILIIAVAIAIVISFKLLMASNSVGTVDPIMARSQGSTAAKVKIVEFIDFECPACAVGAMTLKGYLKKYPNDIHVQVKYYPLMNVHKHALQAANYAECTARQGVFWPFFEPLMEQQQQWAALINAEGIFDQLAQGAGADLGRIKSCLASKDVSTTIMSEKATGRSMGVQSTPTYFINNKMVVGTKSLVEELDTYFPKS